MFREYLDTIVTQLEAVCRTQTDAMEAAAEVLADSLRADGLIYLFGCGHSHMLAEEGFYRAGGLGAVCPILQSEFMLHEGAVKSSALERRSDLAADVLDRYPISEEDTLIVFSTSGVNGMPVEVARLARLRGARVIGVSSGAYARDESRHPLGLHLAEVCEIFIDNGSPHGDASYSLSCSDDKMAPVSTIAGAYILNCLLARAAELAIEASSQVAIYRSGNVAGGLEQNEGIIRRYRKRMRPL